MRYDDPHLQECLAGEYAVGALQGAARRRFEALMHHDPALRRLVVHWQEILTPFSDETPEVVPPPHILEHLTQLIVPRRNAEKPSWWQRLGFWQPLAAVNAVLVMMLVGYISYQALQPLAVIEADLRYVGILADQQGESALVITAYAKPWRLIFETITPLSQDSESELHLWVVERNSGIVRSLAAVPENVQQIKLTKESWQLLKHAKSLIVSKERLGSTPEKPSDMILYSGPCVSLKGSTKG